MNTALSQQPTSALETLAQQVGLALGERGWWLTTAESCTGGWVAQAITAIPGSSAWFERGFVTYTNLAKQEMLGVQADTLAKHGAVSAATVTEMAQGALRHSHAQLAVAISGIAGPGGGSPEKPVGTVWFAWGWAEGVQVRCQQLSGDRAAVREQAVVIALQGLLAIAERHGE